ncbi:kelch domain-containing protein 1 isoform X3 [Rhinoraja longicauda]
MAEAQVNWVAEERSGHCAVLDGCCLYVWGGYVTYENNEVYLPNDEIWVYEIESGVWQRQPMKGDLPRPMSGSCAACLNGVMYIFGGYDDLGYSNELYCVNLQVKNDVFTWKKICNYKGNPPTPRDKLSCWVHKDKLIYFGGYGCKKISELNDSFDVNEASWEEEMFWGWNYDIHVFDPSMNIWYQPTIKGISPRPRAAHACATLGNKGYLFGGRILETRINDLHCLDLDTWTWSGEISVKGVRPQGRSWHTLTPVTDDQLFLFGGLSAESQPLNPLKLCQVGWGASMHSYFQVPPEMFDRVQVQALAGPLKYIHRLVTKPLLRCLGCVLRVVVLLEGEPLPKSEVQNALEQVFIKDLSVLCSVHLFLDPNQSPSSCR